MKKIFCGIGIIGSMLILGAAGMADTYNSEHMFSTLLAGIGLVAMAAVGFYCYKLHTQSKILDRKLKKLRAGV